MVSPMPLVSILCQSHIFSEEPLMYLTETNLQQDSWSLFFTDIRHNKVLWKQVNITYFSKWVSVWFNHVLWLKYKALSSRILPSNSRRQLWTWTINSLQCLWLPYQLQGKSLKFEKCLCIWLCLCVYFGGLSLK